MKKKGQSEIAIGGISGISGAGTMLIVILVAKLFGLVNIPFPILIERRLEFKTGTSEKTSDKGENLIALGLHFLLGTFYGFIYGLLQKFVHLHGFLVGPLFGWSTFLIDEIVVGPALGLTPSPKQMSPVTFWRRFFIKFVYGVTVYLAFDGIRNWMTSNHKEIPF